MEVEAMDHLIKKYLEGKASKEEIGLVDSWYNSFDSKLALFTDRRDAEQAIQKGFSELKAKLKMK